MSLHEDLLKPYVPSGFEPFWREITEEAFAAPLDWGRKPQSEQHSDHHQIETFSFRGIDGQTRYGWLALPPQTQVPGFVWLAPYSRWSMLPNKYGARPGYASISFNFHGESAFHQEEYTPARGYFADGALDRQTWVFRRMYQDSVIITRLFESLNEVDSSRIVSMGMSQGGGMSIWLGAWCKLIKAVVADEPFLGAMPFVLTAKAFRYPLKELADLAFTNSDSEQRVRATLSYFDTLNQAAFCEVPTRVTLGLKDPAVKPDQVRAIYEALPGKRELEELDWGHDWHPQMITGAEQFLNSVFR